MQTIMPSLKANWVCSVILLQRMEPNASCPDWQASASALGVLVMTNKPTVPNKPHVAKDAKKQAGVSHPGMMGDGTEEQNLAEPGNPAARIKKSEVDAVFGKPNRKN